MYPASMAYPVYIYALTDDPVPCFFVGGGTQIIKSARFGDECRACSDRQHNAHSINPLTKLMDKISITHQRASTSSTYDK